MEIRRREIGGQSSPRLYVPRGDSGMTIGAQPRMFVFHSLDG
jgi:hypothetical protein